MVTEGDVIVAQLPQADGGAKSRPVLLLKELPGFGDFLVCGISSQLKQAIDGWDLPVPARTPEFEMSGLKTSSIILLERCFLDGHHVESVIGAEQGGVGEKTWRCGWKTG
jgi:hypothetical protein